MRIKSKNQSPERKSEQKESPKAVSKKSSSLSTETLNPIEQDIFRVLNDMARTDAAFAAKWRNGKGEKDIHKVFNYLLEYHRPSTRKNGDCAVQKAADDHKLAYDFIMNDKATVPSPHKNARSSKSGTSADTSKSVNATMPLPKNATMQIEVVKNGKTKKVASLDLDKFSGFDLF